MSPDLSDLAHIDEPVNFYKISLKKSTDEKLGDIAAIIHNIFKSAFGMATWKEDKILRYLQTFPSLILGYIDREPVLYCAYVLNGYQRNSDFLWIDTIAVIKHRQKSGIGELTLRSLLKDNISAEWVGARTQNPNIVRLIQKCCRPTFPLDSSYLQEDGRALINFCRENIRESQTANSFGVCKGAYLEGRLGDFQDRADLSEINTMFKRIACDRNNGDAAIIIGKLSNSDLLSYPNIEQRVKYPGQK